MAIGVYKITSPNNRVYVGSSKNIQERWEYYSKLNCKSQTRLYNSLKKYGVDKHRFEVITECDVEDMLAIELHWGLFYHCLDRKAGLNCNLPKNSENYKAVSDETREKISKSLKGKKAWNKGKAWSEESKKKMSESSIGSIAWNRKIVLDLETGVFFDSIQSASNAKEIKRTTLQSMLSGINPNKTSLIYA